MIKKNSIVFTIMIALCAMGMPAYAEEPVKEHKALRWYLGGKLGYSGLFVNDIQNLTVGSRKNTYNDFLSSFAIGLNGGMQYSILPSLAVRAELEYLYRTEGTSRKNNEYGYIDGATGALGKYTGNTDFTLSTQTLLANAYLDYYITKMVAVYVGVGVGMSILEAEIDAPQPAGVMESDFRNYPEPDSSKNSVNFAWQVGIGTRIMATENIAVDINTRYIDLGSVPSFGNDTLLKMKSGTIGAIEVLAGVSYVF